MRANSIYSRLRQLFNQASSPPRSREHYSDSDIAFVLLWAEVHRRPLSWACRRGAYPPASRFDPPSGSTMSRRGNDQPVLLLIEQLRLRLIEPLAASPLKLIDSSPLIVGKPQAIATPAVDAEPGTRPEATSCASSQAAAWCGAGGSPASTSMIRFLPSG